MVASLFYRRIQGRKRQILSAEKKMECAHIPCLFQPNTLLQIPPPSIDISHAEWVSEPTSFRARIWQKF